MTKSDYEIMNKFIKGLPEKLAFFVRAGNRKGSADALSTAKMGEAYGYRSDGVPLVAAANPTSDKYVQLKDLHEFKKSVVGELQDTRHKTKTKMLVHLTIVTIVLHVHGKGPTKITKTILIGCAVNVVPQMTMHGLVTGTNKAMCIQKCSVGSVARMVTLLFNVLNMQIRETTGTRWPHGTLPREANNSCQATISIT